MPLVPINSCGAGLSGLPALRALMARTPKGATFRVMAHGYKFSPASPGHCPHRHILSLAPARGAAKAVSWPRHLGVSDAAPGIAFGWHAKGSLWTAWREAERSGRALADLLALLHDSGFRADLIGHSLGARVCLGALARAPAGSVRRVILLTPAEFREGGLRAIASPAGREAEVLNVVSRENDIFDMLVERLVAPHRPLVRSLGAGLPDAGPKWVDLQIDDPAALAALRTLGHPVAAPERRICHWSGYLRPGLFPLYRAFLSGQTPVGLLKERLPSRQSRRWSRLLRLSLPWPALPSAQKASM